MSDNCCNVFIYQMFHVHMYEVIIRAYLRVSWLYCCQRAPTETAYF